mmetsp:Transcript_72089/g.204652  ORF Transcript_72089/g.204652 Transcript_72089/m.204652 type:complete len:222 (+) Transcript_72089:591-1256(+)
MLTKTTGCSDSCAGMLQSCQPRQPGADQCRRKLPASEGLYRASRRNAWKRWFVTGWMSTQRLPTVRLWAAWYFVGVASQGYCTSTPKPEGWNHASSISEPKTRNSYTLTPSTNTMELVSGGRLAPPCWGNTSCCKGIDAQPPGKDAKGREVRFPMSESSAASSDVKVPGRTRSMAPTPWGSTATRSTAVCPEAPPPVPFAQDSTRQSGDISGTRRAPPYAS